MWFSAVVFFLPALAATAAEKASPSKKSGVRPGDDPVSAKSVEALAALARPSVVIITHFGRDGKQDGVGAGFVVASNGLIATSLHVIGEARPISVQLADGRRFDVTEVHAWDRKLDLAVVRIDADALPALALGDSDTLKQGTPVVAMGNPLGLEHSIVQGVVSARRDFDGLEMIQLAIPIEPGNSGGPLLDLQGRVHGLLTLKSAMSANLGFAMPVNLLKPLLKKPNPVPMNRWLTIGALNPREWTPLFGARWTQKAGRIQAETPGTGFGGRSLCLSQKPVPEPPYEIGVSVKLDDEAGAAGLVFGADGAEKHYGFYPSGGQLRLTRFDGSNVFSWSILKQVPTAAYRPGDWNALKVRVEKDKILGYVNGQLVAESESHEFAGHQAGLAKFRETRAAFKDFQIGTNLETAVSSPPQELTTSLTQKIESLSGKSDAEAVVALQSDADASQAVLAARARLLEGEAARLRRLSGAVRQRSIQTKLTGLLEAPEADIDLVHAALLLSQLDNAELDVESYRRQVGEMAREIAAKLPADADGAAKLDALKKYLFEENGFHGSRTDYYNRANSYLNEVLDDREGLPITLSVLFIELSRRIGVETVVGIPLPAHFVVKYVPQTGEGQLFDVFDGGKPLTHGDAAELVMFYTGEPLREEQLKPATKRDILIRMLHNLHGIAQRDEVGTESLRYLDLIIALAPDLPTERLERARLRLQKGDPAGAKQDFKWLLDHAPPGIDLERLAEWYRSL